VFCVCLETSLACASDLTIKSSLSESIEANDNYFLIPEPKGITYAPLNAISLDVLGRTPTTRYDAHGDISFYHYMGPGAADTATPTVKQDSVSVNLEHDINPAGDKFSVTASSRQQDVATAQLNDLGVVTASGEVMTSAIGGSWTRQLTRTDTLAFSATSTKTDFTSSTLAPYVNLATEAVWTRHIGPTTDLIASTEFDWTIQETQARQDTKFWRADTEAQIRPTSRLKLTGSIGVGVVSVRDDGEVGAPGPAPPPGLVSLVAGAGTAAGLLTDAQADYKVTKTTELTLLASRSIVPDVLGQLSARKSYQVVMTQIFNSASNLSLVGGLTEVTASQAGLGASNYWTTSATYTRQLAREWSTQVSYNYRRSETTGSSVSSNALLVKLTRDMTLKP
jgi:hypothetical protein